MTTTMVGVGKDFQSSAGQVYTQGYWALLNYYVLDEEGARIRVASSPGFDIEYTNSNTTTEQREPQLRDINLTSVGNFRLYQNEKKGVGIAILPNATVITPTSEVSRNSGIYLTASPRLTLVEQFTFRNTGDFPKVFALGQSARFDHTFSKATEPVNTLVDRPAQAPTGAPIFIDQYSGVPLARNSLQVGGFLMFIGNLFDNPLELLLSGAWTTDYIDQFEGSACDFTVQADCDAARDTLGLERASNRRVRTAFSIEGAYYPMPEWGFALGYQNAANQLAPDGTRRSPFYSPSAAFTARFILSIDALYEVMTGPRREVRFVLPG